MHNEPKILRNRDSDPSPPRVRLGNSDLMVSPIGLGLWPISGITTLDVRDDMSVETIQAAIDEGINFFDTAYSYGFDGRSDRVLSQVKGAQRDSVVIASKVGMHWDSNRQRVLCGRPEVLVEHARESLERLNVEYVDLMYLHAPDLNVPIEDSAGAIQEIVNRGWARYAGVSNVNSIQAKRFNETCPAIAIQPPFNMLQQETVQELRPFANENQIGLVCYWVLMKGLLAGTMQRDHQFDPNDRRLTYEIFQGDAWNKAQDLLDVLRALARELECTVSQLVTAWTIKQPNISVALVGAKRPQQIRDSASGMNINLDAPILNRIDMAIQTSQL